MKILENGKLRELNENDKIYNVIRKISEKIETKTTEE